MAEYTKLSDGWRVRVSYKTKNGKRRTKSKQGFRTKAAAKLYAPELKKLLMDTNPLLDSKVSLADYFIGWYHTFKEPTLSTRTKRHYLWTHKTISKVSAFTERPMSSLTRTDYQQFLTDFGATHAKETANKANVQIRAAVKNAVYDGLIEKDFTDQTKVVFDKSRTMKIEYLTVSDLKQLIDYTTASLNWHYTSRYMILLACYTGMRLGEIQGLQWHDINFNFKTIAIKRTWSEVEKDYAPTKNESSIRTIRVNKELLDILKSLKDAVKPVGKYQVFISQYGTVPTSAAVNKVLRHSLSDLSINRKGFHFHSLRHTHVAYLLACQVDLYAISKRLGHSDIGTTSRVYSYLIDEYRAQTDNHIDKALTDLSSNEIGIGDVKQA